MLEHALRLAKERGWHVFPCCPWDWPRNAPAERRGKAPLIESGLKGATTDDAQIRRWWSQWPHANIGVACGASGIVVVDIDGAAGWQQIEHGDYDLPETLTSRTGKPQGKHLIYAAGSAQIRNGTGVLGAPGVDVRGDGGYIIAPPSRHYSGVCYEFEDEDAPIAQMPVWLAALEGQRSGRLAAARRLAADSAATINEGRRNDVLFDLGCVFRRDNMIQDVEIMYALLMAENARRCSPPLGPDEVRRIAESACKPLPDEVELPPAGWGAAIVNWAKGTGDPAVVKKAEALRVEIADKLPDAADGRLAMSLIRYVSPNVAGGTFAATISFRNREVTLHGLVGEDLNSPDRIKARCLAEKLVIALPKRRAWDAMLLAAMEQCVDVEVPRDVSVEGACIDAILEFVRNLADTTDWGDFPAGRDRFRFDHGDGSYSVHSETLRQSVRRMVWDSKRAHITAALKSLGAFPHHTPNGAVRMHRIRI